MEVSSPPVTGTATLGVVSTSIHSEPAAYEQWARMGKLIVAGDVNSSPRLAEYVRELGGQYLTPVEQDRFAFSEAIGWRSIQRRNAAIMEALRQGCKFIVTVDDDNFPVGRPEAWANAHITELTHRKVETTVGSATNYLNPGVFCLPRFHARGVPYGIDTDSPVIQVETRNIRVVVSQAQVLGDPDCDAVERMVNAPHITVVQADSVVSPGVYAPFNSQATMWAADWAPVMAVMPGIGRYDDILASFIFNRLAREYLTAVHFGNPPVRQLRNAHDNVKDLRAEYWGMRNVFEIAARLDNAHISADMPLRHAYSELLIALESLLPPQSVQFTQQWLKEWGQL